MVRRTEAVSPSYLNFPVLIHRVQVFWLLPDSAHLSTVRFVSYCSQRKRMDLRVSGMRFLLVTATKLMLLRSVLAKLVHFNSCSFPLV